MGTWLGLGGGGDGWAGWVGGYPPPPAIKKRRGISLAAEIILNLSNEVVRPLTARLTKL